jgi:hypothetical protein
MEVKLKRISHAKIHYCYCLFYFLNELFFNSLRREDGPKEIEVTGIMTMIEEEDHLKDTVGDLLKMIIVAVEEAMTIVAVAETIMDLLEEVLEEEEAREVMVLHRCTADHQVQEMPRGRGGPPPPPMNNRGGRDRGGGGGRRGGREEGVPGISLLVRNIGPSISNNDLIQAFGRIGEVRDVYIPRDYHSQQPKGFAFIEYADPGRKFSFFLTSCHFIYKNIVLQTESSNRLFFFC